MNYLVRQNLECFLAWQEKFRRGYVEHDPWAGVVRYMTDNFLEAKREEARAWLAEKSTRWRKRRPLTEVREAEVVGWGKLEPPRYIWTARSAIKGAKT